MTILTEVAPDFLFLLSRGYVEGASVYKPEEFGNASIILKGAACSFRIERDRGQLFVDVGDKMMGWYKLEHIIEFLDNSITQQSLGEPPDPSLLASHLLKLLSRVTSLFCDEARIRCLHDFVAQKNKALLSRLFETSYLRKNT